MAKKPSQLDYKNLLQPLYDSLYELGGTGSNDEILNKVIQRCNFDSSVIDLSHLGSTTQSELQYNLAWARTYLKKYGVIENIGRSLWALKNPYNKERVELNIQEIVAFMSKKTLKTPIETQRPISLAENGEENVESETEAGWREELSNILQHMDPFGFERLSQRLLRECGFSNVNVTRKSGDGGIDGTGILKINGIFSFNVAFQCKRYIDKVGAAEIRDFRGSLTTDIEKGVFITTGRFSQAARNEAVASGKQQIDLLDGDDFVDKLVEYKIGVEEVKTYKVDKDFFDKI